MGDKMPRPEMRRRAAEQIRTIHAFIHLMKLIEIAAAVIVGVGAIFVSVVAGAPFWAVSDEDDEGNN